MSQIIGLHIGGFGTRIGAQFWNKIHLQEQQLKKQNQILSNYHVFFDEKQKTLSPRCILMDTDPRVHNFQLSDLSLQAHMTVAGKQSSQNIFAQGKYVEGARILDDFIESLRKQSEKCDRLSGFILTGSIGGGCGSGMGSGVLQKLLQDHRYKIVQCFNLLPDLNRDPINHLQIYNSVLSLQSHIQYSNVCIVLQNQALFDNLVYTHSPHPGFKQINSRIVQGIIQHVAPYRFPGHINTNQRKRATNLIMFPRIKFVIPGLSMPFQYDSIGSSFDPINRFMKIRQFHRVYASLISVRDPGAYESEVDMKVRTQIEKYGKGTEWLPCLFGINICKVVNKNYGPSSWSLINCVSFADYLKKLSQYFTCSFRRKAFIYHYTLRGMDEMQFTEAQSNCNDLVSEYVPCSCCYADEDDSEFQVYQEQNM